MRDLAIICLIIIVSSGCEPLKTLEFIDRDEQLLTIDFRKYSNDNFLFTPEKFEGEYKSIGMVDYVLIPGAEYKYSGQKPNPYYSPNTPGSQRYIAYYEWVQDVITIQQALDSLFLKCQQMGADAVVNFAISVETRSYDGIKNPIELKGVRLSGFAIKRQD